MVSKKMSVFNTGLKDTPIKTGQMLAAQVLGLLAKKKILRTFGEVAEIGFSFFIECIFSFLTFL